MPRELSAPSDHPVKGKFFRAALFAVLLIGVLARLSVVGWSDPWGPHHADEHILPLEALALWEGVTPREVGWPASTTRLMLSAAYAGQWFVEEGGGAWRDHQDPHLVFDRVATWIGRQYIQPVGLYRVGRLVSVATGILQLLVLAWAIRRWTGRLGAVAGTFAMALAPLPVLYSQFVLADITGLFFASIVLGLAANPSDRQILIMAAVVGLAAASKFHFGLWLLAPLTCVWIGVDPRRGWRHRVWLSASVVGLAGAVVIALVPWILINPTLALKEFVSVVGEKASGGTGLSGMAGNMRTIFGGLGVLAWFGALLALPRLHAAELRRLSPLILPLVIGTLILSRSGVLFDRYGLVLMPALVVLAGLGWEAWLTWNLTMTRRLAIGAFTVCVAMTAWQLVRAERVAGETDVDVQVQRWIVSHVPSGRRVALFDESNAYLPRAAAQLRDCMEAPYTNGAYREKWRVLGVTGVGGDLESMRSTVLNDEISRAYWCRRELSVQTDPGYFLVPYHDAPRSGAFVERDVIDEFNSGNADKTGGVDVLVVNRPVDVSTPPTQSFETARGRRVIYVR